MYIDSSIIVKLLVDEPETKALVTALVGQALVGITLFQLGEQGPQSVQNAITIGRTVDPLKT